MSITYVSNNTHRDWHASNATIRLSLMVGLAGLDVPVEPTGVSVLTGCLAVLVIRRVGEDR